MNFFNINFIHDGIEKVNNDVYLDVVDHLQVHVAFLKFQYPCQTYSILENKIMTV